MKKFLIGLFVAFTTITASAISGGDKVINFYVDQSTGSLMSSEHGVDVEHANGTVANYTITIENLGFSEFHCQCVIKIDANGNHPWDKLFIYRLRYLNARDADDMVDVEQHALEDPTWNAFEFSNVHLWFEDTFRKDWIDGYDLCYKIHDITNNHHLYIVIHNAFGHSIITDIEEVTIASQPIYYSPQGHRSTTPFNGVNIVVVNNKAKKVIY